MTDHENEDITAAESLLADASMAQPQLASLYVKKAHVHAMLAVAQEIFSLHQTIGAYLEASTHPIITLPPS